MASTILQPLIAKLTARSALGRRDIDALLRMPHVIKRFSPGDYLVRERKPATHTCILLTGFAYRQKIVTGGARQIVGLQVPGDPVDLHNSMLDVSDHSVQGLTEGVMAQVARDDILALAAANPAIAHAFWIDTLVDGSIAREWIVNIGRRSAPERLAHMLCEFARLRRIAGIEQGELLDAADDAGADGRRAGADAGARQPHGPPVRTRGADRTIEPPGDDPAH